MSERRIDAEALLELALETLRGELLEALPAERRYAGAMVANAVEIARRAIAGGQEEAQWALLDRVYEEGEGSLERLARDIRDGEVDEDGVPDLHAALKSVVVAELAVTNPRFLASRGLLKGKR